jgi:hypothetical protein
VWRSQRGQYHAKTSAYYLPKVEAPVFDGERLAIVPAATMELFPALSQDTWMSEASGPSYLHPLPNSWPISAGSEHVSSLVKLNNHMSRYFTYALCL